MPFGKEIRDSILAYCMRDLPDVKQIAGMPPFCDELIRIYEVRNAIHLHAELKKEIDYHLALSKIAY